MLPDPPKKPPSSASDLAVIPLCQQQLLSFCCDLEAGHDGFHHDGTTRTLVRVHWPPRMPPQIERKQHGQTNVAQRVS